MIENSPTMPFGSLIAHLNLVEKNMNARRADLANFLGPDERLITVSSFPRWVLPASVVISFWTHL
jgi:hypothetical protein